MVQFIIEQQAVYDDNNNSCNPVKNNWLGDGIVCAGTKLSRMSSVDQIQAYTDVP